MAKFTIAIGNSFDGLEFYGIFDDHDAAIQEIDNHRIRDWYIVPIHDIDGIDGIDA